MNIFQSRKGQGSKYSILAFILLFDALIIFFLGFIGQEKVAVLTSSGDVGSSAIIKFTGWHIGNYISSFSALWGFDLIFVVINIVLLAVAWNIIIGGG